MSKHRESITLNEMWEKLSIDIEYLFQFQTLRYSQWMLLYTYIFDYCTNNRDSSRDLYDSFRNYLINYVEKKFQSNADLQEQDIVEYYFNQWKKYRISSKILHGICSYLNRHYIQHEQDSGNSDICEIYRMSIQIWQQVVSQLFYQQITRIYLNMIKADRNHEQIDSEILSNIIQTYVITDINRYPLNFDDTNENLDYYQEYFENDFFKETQEFYRLKVKTYLQEQSLLEYLSKIPQYINEEIHRMTSYLHPSSIIKLIKKLEEVFIYDQMIAINDEAKVLINNEKIPELNFLYQTVNRMENGLKNIFENHIYQIGIQTIENINPISTQDLKIYIQTISDLHEKYSIFIQKTFDNDQEFIDVLNRTFQKFVNDNIVTQTIGNTAIMAEYLARNCDRLLRKGRKDETGLEKLFDQIKIVLFYIRDKDVFSKFYLKFLAKRLINQANISNDYEKLMISNIQLSCGFEYVCKMKQMCQDIEISENILNEYSKSQSNDNLNILILNSNAWLLSISSNIILPDKLQLIYENFNKFYQTFYQGRKLIWLYQYSKGELQTFFTNKIYTLQVSMYQMIILLLFNNSLELTIETIYDKTQINIDLLIQILNSLCQSKILISTKIIDQVNLDMKSQIRLSNNFINDKYLINLNNPMKSLEQNNTNILHKKINQDRTLVIQAAIVRIIKLHKIIHQNLLIQTVIEQLNSHFNPDVTMIKDCINILIKKEYLERSSENKDLLCYI